MSDPHLEEVNDSKTDKVTHEEQQCLSEINNQRKKRRKILQKLGKRGLGAISGILIALIGSLIWFYILPLLQQPIEPKIISTPNPNPIINTTTSADVKVTLTLLFIPPYQNDIVVTIPNDNLKKCNMVLEFKTTYGFKFLPISGSLPQDVVVAKGYEYQDTMKVAINNFLPKFSQTLVLSVYTLDPNIYKGTENITYEVLAISFEN